MSKKKTVSKATGMKALALKLCAMEGGKKQVNIAQCEDLLDKLTTLIAIDNSLLKMLWEASTSKYQTLIKETMLTIATQLKQQKVKK